MSIAFNVLEQGWIPVIRSDGSRQLLGIRETLSSAHELREISDPSPLKEYSLYRFLGLFLMDAIRPEKRSSIRALLRAGRFDPEQIERYIALCRSEGVSFDLFDAERPFLQSRFDEKTDGAVKPVSILDCTLPSGNNHTHFNHESPKSLAPEQAVRLLLTTYWFCTAQAQGYPSGVYGAPPLFGVIKGINLFETLSALLIPIDSIGLAFDDPPVFWRRTAPVVAKAEIGKTSWLQGMLFPTRRIHLVPDETGTVVGVHLCQGENYINKEAWVDPYVTYRSNDTTVFPLRPHADSPIWRNICDIIDIPGDHASRMLALYRANHGDQNVHLTLYGAETSQASYLSVQRYDLVLPLRLAEQEYVELLTACISAAQSLRRALDRAVNEIEIASSSSASACSTQYDRMCEDRFWRLCEEADFHSKSAQEFYVEYCTDISRCVLRAYDSLLSSLRLRAKSLAKAEEKRKNIYFETKKLTGGTKKE